MRSSRRKTTSARFLLWAVLVMALAAGAYLAGAQLAGLWATPLSQEPLLTTLTDDLDVGFGRRHPIQLSQEPLLTTLTDEPRRVHQIPVTNTTPATPEATPAGHAYTVVEGDTLWDIALDFDVTVQAIMEVNEQLTSPGEIYPGLELYIPAPQPTPTPLPEGYYIVQFGDTLWSLAWEFQCTIEDWLAANSGTLESPFDQLDVGQVLRIPEHSSLDEPLNCARVPERQEVITYVVRSGDNLSCLAHKFGISIATIRWTNIGELGDDPDRIDPGQMLTILPLDGMLHIVVEGETLEGIAEQYRVEVADIVAWGPNGLGPHDQLTVGQRLVVPNGTHPAMYLWRPVPVATPGGQATPVPGTPADQPTPTPRPQGPALPGGIPYVDPFYLVSEYDTGYCPNPPSGWGWSGGLSWPTDSHDVHPHRGFQKSHPAIDILAPLGSPVYAAETGVVIWAGYNTWGYGNLVVLDHGGGWLTLYVHLAEVSVECGQAVRRGGMVGTVGQTGQSNFPHLHFEVSRNGYNFDPLTWLP